MLFAGRTQQSTLNLFLNFDLESIITPIDPIKLHQLLTETNYNKKETRFLVNGFLRGFDIGYEGPEERRETSNNIPLQVGNKEELWEKMMSEVKLKRFAGPYLDPPFEYFIQSPVGLVPKSNGKTRLIFHLSYKFGEEEGRDSVNSYIPKDKCRVKYQDLDYAVRTSFKWCSPGKCYYSKTDIESAFRLLPLSKRSWNKLLMRVRCPINGVPYFFVEKSLSFGSSISCSHFQRFSDAVKHIIEVKARKPVSVTNYLDDFLFLGTTAEECNRLVRLFLSICDELHVPVVTNKTVWACTKITFLGILLNGDNFTLSIPEEKRIRARNQLSLLCNSKKTKVGTLESLVGLLNFLGKAIVPGRAFTRRMYSKFTGKNRKLKKFHHVSLDDEFRNDCKTWLKFLTNHTGLGIARPYMDMSITLIAEEIDYFSDASAAEDKGFGIFFKNSWTYAKWEENYIKDLNPGIAYLELYALVVGIFIWGHRIANTRVIVHCDNNSVCKMVANISTGGENSMKLIRMLVGKCMELNLRIFTKHLKSAENDLADSLSRLQFTRFRNLVRRKNLTIDPAPSPLPDELWPASKLWIQ